MHAIAVGSCGSQTLFARTDALWTGWLLLSGVGGRRKRTKGTLGTLEIRWRATGQDRLDEASLFFARPQHVVTSGLWLRVNGIAVRCALAPAIGRRGLLTLADARIAQQVQDALESLLVLVGIGWGLAHWRRLLLYRGRLGWHLLLLRVEQLGKLGRLLRRLVLGHRRPFGSRRGFRLLDRSGAPHAKHILALDDHGCDGLRRDGRVLGRRGFRRVVLVFCHRSASFHSLLPTLKVFLRVDLFVVLGVVIEPFRALGAGEASHANVILSLRRCINPLGILFDALVAAGPAVVATIAPALV
ncbi:hypothetical protein BKA80DRAFT_277066 [Phyllosticta citrichinensis]